MVRLRWDREEEERRDTVKMKLFRELSSPGFVSKFRNLTRRGELKDLTEYLETLKKILRKDFPQESEMEEYVPKYSKVRKKYEEVAEELGTVPEPAESREVYLRIVKGPKYKAYKRRAERTLAKIEAIENMTEKIKKLKPYSSRQTPTRLSARLARKLYFLEIERTP
ncbi:hypothetical protein AKJ37_06245 [candidate division MSBL1 archaeon SCGC-AAA259I09]|uniref:Uncharacterized protein n=1 Tax=candidate division MSBL1 archaeon SCGC-AAA259I09 TaxID=1698267 RepID=A0A133UPE9_9EURY|nr:hypothetical protein AKJ37_06245 [candidate division MSBL1 archaeon SCGC-AAA259I09]